MKKGKTELVFILDRSGSMSGLETDTIGGFNAMLKQQKEVDGECFITTVLFDHEVMLLHDRIDIQAVSPMTAKQYFVRGSTALLDAAGSTINKIISVQRNTAEEHQAEKVLFVIITDGEENSSREYSLEKVRQMIEHQKEHYNWEFIFLGANIDAVSAAAGLGIHSDRSQNFVADRLGTNLNFRVMSEAVESYRMGSAMPEDWKDEIDRDYKKRKKSK